MVKQMDLRLEHYNEVLPSLNERRAQVLRAFTAYGPATCEEIAGYLHWQVTSVRPRATELYQMKKLIRTGERRDKQYVFTTGELIG